VFFRSSRTSQDLAILLSRGFSAARAFVRLKLNPLAEDC
jgi:hypothetical protein